MHHENASPQAEGKQNVHERACQSDDETLPAGMGQELPRIAGTVIHGVFARHLNVAAQGQNVDAIVGAVFGEANQTLAEPDGELLNPDAKKFGGSIVAELMNENHESEHNAHIEDGMKEGQKLGHIN